MAFSVGYVAGVTPDKWSRVWRRREIEELNLSLVESSQQESALAEGLFSVCFVRLPIDRNKFHCIPLYRERPVVVVPTGHVLTAYDEVALVDLTDEQLVHGEVPRWSDLTRVEQLPFPDMSVKDAIDVVASGTGIVIVPMSVARLHHRKDVEHRPVLDVPDTEIGLAWRVDDEDPRIQTFIGIVRGRTDNSSRGSETGDPAAAATPPKKPQSKKPAAKKAATNKTTAQRVNSGTSSRRRTTSKPSKRRR